MLAKAIEYQSKYGKANGAVTAATTVADLEKPARIDSVKLCTCEHTILDKILLNKTTSNNQINI